jgi:PhnB protein
MHFGLSPFNCQAGYSPFFASRLLAARLGSVSRGDPLETITFRVVSTNERMHGSGETQELQKEKTMLNNAKPIPDGYHAITPYLFIKDAAKAIEFYKQALGATERMRLSMPGGNQIGHAELAIGDSVIMLSDECPDMSARGPESLGGSPVALHVYVEDVDAVVQRAVAAGATLTQPVEDKFYGDRTGGITDPFGHLWYIATHTEDVSPEEVNRRATELFQSKSG